MEHGKENFPPRGSGPSEILRRDQESGGMVIEGKDLIKEVNEAKLENLPEVLEQALSFKEGLIFGPDDYNLDSSETRLYLMNLFTSSESASKRPNSPYLDSAIRERVRSGVRKIKKRYKKEGRSWNEFEEKDKDEIKQLMSLENHVEGRAIIDATFIQRMETPETAKSCAELVGRTPEGRLSIKPDKGHWQAFLQGEFGLGVDKVLRRIVKMKDVNELPEDIQKTDTQNGVYNNIYAEGFKNDKIFGFWLKDLLKEAEGKMDVVWAAWRLALIWEIPATIGIGKTKMDIDKDKGVYTEVWNFADPPIGNDLINWTAHLEKKRATEFGYDIHGKRLPGVYWKHITHTGYPLSLGHICPEGKKQLCESFLHGSKVEEYEQGRSGREKSKKSSLWKLWWEKGDKLGGDFDKPVKERGYEILPWALTELQPHGLDTDELGAGSFGMWLLNRHRAFGVQELVRSRPSLRDVSDPDFFAQNVRNWNKVLGTAGNNIPPEENPRTWWVAGILAHSHVDKSDRMPLIKNDPNLAYRTSSAHERWGTDYLGLSTSKKSSVHEILNNAFQCGFLREKDINWLFKNLNIPSKIAGGSDATRIL